MRRSHYHILRDKPHFITCTVVNGTPLFCKAELAQIILNSLSFLQHQQRLTLYGYLIMENRIHLIVSAGNLSKEIGNFKLFTARSIINSLKENQGNNLLNQLEFYKLKHKTDRECQVWHEEFHAQTILNEEIFRQKLDYIHDNAVKRGYANDPIHWRYSSYRNCIDHSGLLQVKLINF